MPALQIAPRAFQRLSHLHPFRFCSSAATHCGSVRTLNEDAHLDNSDAGLWAVADGMGGHAAGDIASRTVISRLSAVADMSSAFAFRRAVRNALFKANGDLQALANNEFLDTVGSTVVALIAHGGHYACTWAGDSRAYILRDATLTRITTDHSVAQQLVDAGAESEAGARSRQDASIITRAVGACSKLELDGVYGRIQQGDRFLLCSDGLVAAISEAEIAADLGRTPTAYAASRLVDLALKYGVSDNVTAIVVEAAAG